jgi:hypothetical protein
MGAGRVDMAAPLLFFSPYDSLRPILYAMPIPVRPQTSQHAPFFSLFIICLILAAFSAPAHAQVTYVVSANGVDTDEGSAIAVSPSGTNTVAGAFETSADFTGDGQPDITAVGNDDIFVARYDANGALQWVISAGGSGTDKAEGVAVDGDGNVYVTGFFDGDADFDGDGQSDVTATGGNTDDDIFVAKYDPTGSLLWVNSAGAQFAPETGNDIEITSGGNVVLTGNTAGDTDFDGDGQSDVTSAGSTDFFVAQYDAAGTLQWVQGGGDLLFDEGFGIGTDGAGNVYVTGEFRGNADLNGDGQVDATGSSFLPNIFTAQFDATGALQWVNAPGTGSGKDVDVRGDGVSVVTGSFQGNVDFDGDGQTDLSPVGSADVFVASYDASGTAQWFRGAGGAAFDEGLGAAVDASGNGYVTGYVEVSTDGADFDGDGQADIRSGGTFGLFVAKYAVGGMLEEVYGTGGNGTTRGLGLDLDGSENAYVTGDFAADADFDNDGQTDVSSTGSRDVFVARYDATVLPVELAQFTGRADGEAALLTWTTVTETNNAGFFVEQATGSGSWTTIGQVDGAGTTSTVQRYQFRTGILAPGAYSFRLRQVDIDGTEAYSRPTDVNLSLSGAYRIVPPFPNPSAGDAQLRLAVENTQNVQVSVFDVLGRHVATLHDGPITGSTEATIRLGGDLSPGLYLVRITGETFRVTERLTIVR